MDPEAHRASCPVNDDPCRLLRRRAHRWRLWLLLAAQLPALALIVHAPSPGPWLGAVWGVAVCLYGGDSDTPWCNRILALLALLWIAAGISR